MQKTASVSDTQPRCRHGCDLSWCLPATYFDELAGAAITEKPVARAEGRQSRKVTLTDKMSMILIRIYCLGGVKRIVRWVNPSTKIGVSALTLLPILINEITEP